MLSINKWLYAVVLVLASTLVSCGVVASAIVGSPKKSLKNASRLTAPDGREVILVPMCHINTEDRYSELRSFLDRRKAEGYVTFYEGVVGLPCHIDTVRDISYPELCRMCDPASFTAADSLRADTLYRKFRRIVGLIPNAEYKTRLTRRTVLQSSELLGMTTERDIWVDYPLLDLIERYEREYGPVPLSDYDFQTALDDTDYNMKKSTGTVHPYVFLNEYREDLLLRRILETVHPKVVVVYGASHIWHLKLRLRNLEGYTLDKKYKAKKQ